jgi:hypothetical protein
MSALIRSPSAKKVLMLIEPPYETSGSGMPTTGNMPIEQEMKTVFDYKDQSSIWLTDTKMKRFKQGEEYAKKKQDSRDINDKNQVFIYSKALSRKK